MQKRRNQRRRGFTLIEIMAVVVIIGLLMTLVANGIIGNIQKSRVTATQVKIQQVGAALTSYYMDNGRFPSSEQGLRALFEKPSGAPEPRGWRPGGYLDKKEIPRDAWENDLQYASPGVHNPDSFDLWSLGADAKEGGADGDADLGNWTESSATP